MAAGSPFGANTTLFVDVEPRQRRETGPYAQLWNHRYTSTANKRSVNEAQNLDTDEYLDQRSLTTTPTHRTFLHLYQITMRH